MMKASMSKTVHVDKRPSFAGNLVTIFAGRAERTAESTALRQNLPGKSHVGRILLNDNTSQERLLDMRLSDIHNARKKTATFITHQKKTFINRMEHRQSTWVREHSRRANSLNSLARKKGDHEESRDIEEEGEETNLEGEQGENKNVGLPEIKEKHSDGADSLPDITRGVRAVKSNNGVASGSRVGEGRQGNISLPSLQKTKTLDKPTTSAEGIRLPSVLITSDAEADLANHEVLTTDEGVTSARRKPHHRAETVPFREVHLTGPSPTFISEALPRIQIKECPRLPTQRGRKMRGHHRRRKRSSATRGCDNDPLEDDRFLRLQHTLAPHLAWQESRDISSIAGGVIAAKKLVSEKRLRKANQFNIDSD
ncbi:uncharacterized protein [Asterias amurensis]|uniref:uncharacterized protein n=1 Tax=Asterias amurensis TaxID=7602 RepID=UPI003AB6D165